MNLKNKWILILFLFTIQLGPVIGQAAENIFECSAGDLRKHHCHFEIEKDIIDLDSASIKITHGGRFSMTSSPIPGDDTEWENAKISVLKGRVFLEFLVWEPLEGQQLRWVTFEILAGRLHKIGSEVVQERAKNADPTAAQKFVDSEKDDYGIEVTEKGKINWHHSGESKNL